MSVLSKPVPVQREPDQLLPGNDRGGRSGPLTVLCVFGDLLFLDRLRRNLEQGRKIFVEISFSAEDALHLMGYLFFDAVITDCTSWHGEPNGFVHAMRERGIDIPVIYFTSEPVAECGEEVRRSANFRCLEWEGRAAVPPFDMLVQCLQEVTGPGS